MWWPANNVRQINTGQAIIGCRSFYVTEDDHDLLSSATTSFHAREQMLGISKQHLIINNLRKTLFDFVSIFPDNVKQRGM